MIRVVLIGATGSIGRSTLDVVRALPEELQLVGVFAHTKAKSLAAIASEFSTRWAGVDASALPALKAAFDADRCGAGSDYLEEAIANCDVVLSAATGAAGLPASVATVRLGKTLALANKESMVLAGPLLNRYAAESGARILPVDSEHSAIFQALRAGRRTPVDEVKKVILTASGGPFRTWSAENIERATPQDALDHPTWSMGRKITVDSATLMNKGLELIEARWLFELAPEQLDVVVHPQSIVHSMVEFVDGSVVAQMGRPDMRLPIQHALTYPERRPSPFVSFDVNDYQELTFEAPDRERFPALDLAERAIRLGGTAGAVFNAANEIAVDRFLGGEIGFPAIAETVARVMDDAVIQENPDLDDIYAADHAAREDARKCPK